MISSSRMRTFGSSGIRGIRFVWTGFPRENYDSLIMFDCKYIFLAVALCFGLTSCISLKCLQCMSSDAGIESDGVDMIAGDTLGNWKITDFAGGEEVKVEDGVMKISMGIELTGVNWEGDLPQGEYEMEFEARRMQGNDFFCGLTFPVNEKHATLVLGGWGGALVGISSLDNLDASENETGDVYVFEDQQWYKVKLQVLEGRIKVWINGESQINVNLENREVGMRSGEIEQSVPLGIATWMTSAEIRNMVMRELGEEPENTETLDSASPSGVATPKKDVTSLRGR